MGACYYIEYNIFPKNTEKCRKALNEYMRTMQIPVRSLSRIMTVIWYGSIMFKEYLFRLNCFIKKGEALCGEN